MELCLGPHCLIATWPQPARRAYTCLPIATACLVSDARCYAALWLCLLLPACYCLPATACLVA
jgi:hypothetical protein